MCVSHDINLPLGHLTTLGLTCASQDADREA